MQARPLLQLSLLLTMLWSELSIIYSRQTFLLTLLLLPRTSNLALMTLELLLSYLGFSQITRTPISLPQDWLATFLAPHCSGSVPMKLTRTMLIRALLILHQLVSPLLSALLNGGMTELCFRWSQKQELLCSPRMQMLVSGILTDSRLLVGSSGLERSWKAVLIQAQRRWKRLRTIGGLYSRKFFKQKTRSATKWAHVIPSRTAKQKSSNHSLRKRSGQTNPMRVWALSYLIRASMIVVRATFWTRRLKFLTDRLTV